MRSSEGFWLSRYRSFGYAWEGLVYLIRSQPNARIHLLVTGLVISAAAWLELSLLKWAMLVLAITSVWASEGFNTAIESVVDLVEPKRHPLAKIAKDVAAASVLFSAFGAATVGVLVLGPPLVGKLLQWIS